MPNDMTNIEHLVILMMENRSFDHYLGSLSLPAEGRADVEGLINPPRSVPDNHNNPVSQWDMGAMVSGYADPPHGPAPQVANFNNGRNDGFVQQYQIGNPGSDPKIPMGYYTRATLPIIYALADQFTVCDHWFSSMLSSTWPNRKYLYSGERDADDDTHTLPAFPGFNTMPFLNALEDTVNPTTNDKLTWKCYFSDLPFLAFWYKFSAFHLPNFTSVDNFVADCQADTLPTVSIIDPPFSLADDHPSHNVQLGQKFMGLIVDAVTHSESWRNMAIVILYDENGGFYDHVPPPAQFNNGASVIEPPYNDSPLGFRVPALVISPYAKQKFVSKTYYDHTSVLKSINTRWNVPLDPAVFGTRWRNAPDIWTDCFNFNQNPLDMGTYTEADGIPPFANLTWTAGIQDMLASPVGTLEGLLERLTILPVLKALDRRAQVFDNLQAMEQKVISLKRMLA